ncbi:MAG: FAD-dependent oxidoreductase [Bacteroidota bacterium]
MVHTDYLIIGQGMAGTLLSYELMQAGKSVMVIDTKSRHNTSLVASAVINPLVGKNWTLAKEAERIIPVALETYHNLNQLLNEDLVQQKSILVFHRDELSADNFSKQKASGNPYLIENNPEQVADWFAPFGIGEVNPVYTIDAQSLLRKWADFLLLKNALLEEQFQFDELKISTDKIQYKEVIADKIVFCEGAIGRQNPFFPALNFTQNRGDALLLSIPHLSTEHIYHKDFRLVPHRDNLFWCGSNYIWEYDSLVPDTDWRKETERELKNWLKLHFETVDHWVAERPTTAGQQSLMLQNEQHKNLYFFNGLGTRGFSAGPSLAKEMAQLVLND